MVKKVLFLGYGRMGAALGESWLSAGLVDSIDAVDPGRTDVVTATLYRTPAELPAGNYDALVIAVKPAMARDALQAVPADRLEGACLISVMAGVSVSTLQQALLQPLPVVRAMPNTPVLVRQGCTGLYGGEGVSKSLRETISALFSAVGAAFWVELEHQLHAVTALSGSGPAYYHLFSEALAEAGEKFGLPRHLANQLAARTALGAASLQCQENADFAELRRTVTSPGGTTQAAIEVFEADVALRTLVTHAARKAYERSEELSRE